MAQDIMNKSAEKKSASRRTLLPLLLALLPVVLIVLYYILNYRIQIMDWVLTNISLPYRASAAQVTSFGPFQYFSLAEAIITLLILWVLYFIVKTIIIFMRHSHRLLYLVRRIYIIAVIVLYIVASFSWIWGTGYHSTNFAEKTGLDSSGITVSQLTDVTKLFAEKVNELSTQVKRDADNHFIEDRQNYFTLGKDLYANIEKEFPELGGESYPSKPMIYSKLMSACGFSGVYIALTGETNINIDAPACFMPATIAHEMAHQRGINSEEEANFAAIAACITSNIPVYEYSGYLLGLTYLVDTLGKADSYACRQITSTFNAYVIQDWNDNSDYCINHETPAAETAMSLYDGYLKSNDIASGVNSYGACVDMLVSWLAKSS
ncbi:MAG: hypothetical protein CVU91_05770 [Firmicutes bacterium HGW-Firmicutes-16]|nr:MAG: hypothetical protein CVU91_05770 [Firmicutes bacterium HGW-Firmicutes-16]